MLRSQIALVRVVVVSVRVGGGLGGVCVCVGGGGGVVGGGGGGGWGGGGGGGGGGRCVGVRWSHVTDAEPSSNFSHKICLIMKVNE